MRIEKFVEEIRKRGGETTIDHQPYGELGWKSVETRELEVLDRGKSENKTVYLLGCEGWRYYSRNFGSRRATLRYLCGIDDSGTWAVRVPGTIGSAKEAVDWVTPKAVVAARKKRQPVLRQGNLYLIKNDRAKNHIDSNASFRFFADVAEFGNHEYYSRARVLLHPEHKPLRVPPGRWVAVVQKSLVTHRGGAAD
jgi:hypothetical protein